MLSTLKIWMQFTIPQHLLTRLAGLLMESRIPWIKNKLITTLMHHFKIDLTEAQRQSADEYKSFNDFFTRALQHNARPLDDNPFVSPVDGEISQIGHILSGSIIQAKGKAFDLTSLLAVDLVETSQFNEGQFATIYLSPRDYHRVHMPITGTLTNMVHVPGQLFSVNKATTGSVKHLFARNERVICLFNTAIGPVAIILVGALIVGSIETVWAGQITPKNKKEPHRTLYSVGKNPIVLKQGEELGRFKMGSTVIVLLPKHASTQWSPNLSAGSLVKVGEGLCIE